VIHRGFAGSTKEDFFFILGRKRTSPVDNTLGLSSLVASDKGSPLLVVQDTPAATVSREMAIKGLEDPEEGKKGECQSRPMDEGVALIWKTLIN